MENLCFENRELSWLRFNERVLEEAEDERLPLCERLSFLSIFQSNLDEFYMVRIGSLHDMMLLDEENRDNKTKMTPLEQIEAAVERTRELCVRRGNVYRKLMDKLAEQGITLLDFSDISEKSEKYLREMFKNDFMPLLSTFVVGKKQSFPFLQNKEIYAVASLTAKGGKSEKGDKTDKTDKADKTEKTKIGIVPCGSSVFPRLIPVPDRTGCFMLAEELILHCLPLVFSGYKVKHSALGRITRNADIDADSIYDEDLNYRDHMAEVVKLRKKLCPVRIEVTGSIEHETVKKLCDQIKLDSRMVFMYDTPLDVSFFSGISDSLRSRSELFYAPRHPQRSVDFDESRSILDQIEEGDKMLHYPYQSIRPFLKMLSDAAHDPSVISIKMTLYRLASDSKVVESLAEAAENGKQVDVLVELKARFDEENNIEWSRRLERAGCHVIYGLDGLKVHSKLCLILRRKKDGIKYITQIGTGNYNEKTSRFYTDISIMTADPDIGHEASAVFQALTLGETVDHMQHLLVAPHCLQNKLIDLIDREIEKQKQGGNGRIRVKLNSLTDKVLMDKLIEASRAGVPVEMVIRGICCLRPGVEGFTDNVKVISIVGRYLEHSRIYIFGEDDDADIYISSADWMTRNTLRRVEVALPVYSDAIKKRLIGIFKLMQSDNIQARDMLPDGSYKRRFPGKQKGVSCQDLLYDEAYRLAAESSEQ